MSFGNTEDRHLFKLENTQGNMQKKMMILAFLWLVQFGSAVIVVQNTSIYSTYQSGDIIHGKINLAIKEEPASSLLQSNFPGNISLLDLLRANGFQQGVDYNCSTLGCTNSYLARDTLSDIDITDNLDQTIGFAIKGREISIQSLDFLVSSSLGLSCMRQLEILLPSNESIHNVKYLADASICEITQSGCFDRTLDSTRYKEALLSSENYCNKITLDSAPSYEFSARISATENSSIMTMKLFDASLQEIGRCRLPAPHIGISTVGCIINQSVVKRGDYFICISAANTPHYKIRFEEEGNICGGAGIGETTSEDYEILARPLPYGPINNLSVKRSYDATYHDALVDRANEYLERVYDRDCNNTCVIPFILRGGNQAVQFHNISVIYLARGTTRIDSNLYQLEPRIPLITSNRPLSIELAPANFVIPSNAEKKFVLKLNDISLLGTGIPLTINEGADFDISPRMVPLGIDTLFFIISPLNISGAVWKFGEGTVKTLNGRTAMFRYTNAGNYTLDVSITVVGNAITTKRFDIVVGNANESAARLIASATTLHANVTRQINALQPQPLRNYINERLNISHTATELQEIRRKYTLAINESMYAAVVQQLLTLPLPEAVTVTRLGTLPFDIGFARIDTSYVEELTNKSISENQREKLRLTLIDWNEKNYHPNFEFKVVAVTDSAHRSEPVATYVKLTFNQTIKSTNPVYLVIDRPSEDIQFIDRTNAQPLASDTHQGVALSVGEQPSIEFIAVGDVPVAEMGIFLTPSLEMLGNFEEQKRYQLPELPKGRLMLWIWLLLIGLLAAYILLQEAYKRHYERYLFHNPDDLYNIIHFIYNSRISSMNDDTIRSKLRETDWKGEQITYAFKKIDGKRTGMLEIPIFSFFERRKVRAELEKRTRGPIDVRFIKRS